jgi:hypothetical protein
MRTAVGINRREYKLLLDPKEFCGEPEGKAPARLWRRLKAIIDDSLDKRDGGRAVGAFQPKPARHVAFFDTRRHFLDKLDFALRARTPLRKGEPDGGTETTLKFRSADLLLATEYRHAVTDKKKEIEEDISPLQVARPGRPIAVAHPRSLYSRFAISTEVKNRNEFRQVDEVVDKVNWLGNWLAPRANGDHLGNKLCQGPTIVEWIFEGASVWLGDGVGAKFTLTLWYLDDKNGKVRKVWEQAREGHLDPVIAEISFDFGFDEAKGGTLNAAVAERATALFLAMQKLPTDRKHTSKTKLGLPN